MYMEAPISPSKIGEVFVNHDRQPLTEENRQRLADIVNQVALEHAVWINPEKDNKEFKIDGVVVELGGTAVRFASSDELAIFPPKHAA
jgi:hypothetical protein